MSETTNTTPRVCYWLNEVDSEGGYAVSRVRENETGHYPYTRLPDTMSLARCKAEVKRWNLDLGITPQDAEKIVLSSMFPGANTLPVSPAVTGNTVEVTIKIKVTAKLDDWADEYGMSTDEAHADIPGHVEALVTDALAVHPWFKGYRDNMVTVEVTA